MLLPQRQSLPYTNTRLLTAEELENDDSYFSGTVVRLFHSPNSHPAVRQTLQGLSPRRVSLGALALQALCNKRGPDGVVGVIPGEEKHSARLLKLCQQCHDAGEVLACSLPSADMVLVPREPSTAAQDGLYFLAYATNLKAVELCEQLRQQRQVAVVLDLDNTLVDAVSCTIAPNDWDLLDWHYVLVTNSHNRQIRAQYAPLPGRDPYSDDVWVMHWKVGRVQCTFKVRVRRGWAELREFLGQNLDKYATFVCSKGKREYIQLLWLMLDPQGLLIPEKDWDARLTSTYPDTLSQAANKSALTALGCYDITKPHVPTQVAVPMMCLDDSAEAYEPEYDHSIMYVQEYRPSDLLEGDNGNVLRQARNRLESFWTATCTSDGTFAWQAAQSFAMALMKTTQRNPMGSPDDLSYLQVRCAKQGEALWHQFTVRQVFGDDGVFIADAPDSDAPRRTYLTPEHVLCTACQLPECKPGCPVGALPSQAPASAPLACHASAPLSVAAAADAAFSEGGHSSEDSVLLGLPSPTCSVLAPMLSTMGGLHRVSPSAASDASPTAEPAPKQQRLGCWDSAAADAVAAAAVAVEEGHPCDAWGGVQVKHAGAGGSPMPACTPAPQPAAAPADTPMEAALTPETAPAPVAATDSALAAALRSISKGLGGGGKEEEDGVQEEAEGQASLAVKQLPLPLPPARSLAPWERPQRLTMDDEGGVQAEAPPAVPASSISLSAALASISKGLLEDGIF